MSLVKCIPPDLLQKLKKNRRLCYTIARIDQAFKSLTMPSIGLLSAGMFCISIACSTPKKITKAKGNNLNVAGKENAENKILFLTFNITLVDSVSDTHVVSLVYAAFAPGRLHQNAFRSDTSLDPYYLYCEIAGDDKKRTTLLKVQNPLFTVLEYSPEPGILNKKLFVKKSGEISLRFQYTKASKYLTIYKPDSGLRTLKKIYHAQI